MKIKVYINSLPDEAAFIRETVFVKEQGFNDEFDKTDSLSTHLVAFYDDKPVGTCRFYNKDGVYYLGRLAVLKQYRSKRIGAQLVKKAVALIKAGGGKKLCLHSQLQAVPFYEKQGFISYGEIDYDEACPHIWMSKSL